MYDVLLVDDELIILEGLKKILDWEDYGLELKDAVLSGKEALALLRRNHYDILITDVYMKDMSGLDLLYRLNDEKIPVKSIIISGYDKFDYVKKALSLGIENYLLKPLNETELSSTLINTIEKLNQERVTKEINRLGSDVLFDSVIYRWLNSNIEHDELKSRAELLDINITGKYYTVIIIKLINPSSVASSDDDIDRPYGNKNFIYAPFTNDLKNSLRRELSEIGSDAFKADVYSTLSPNNNVLTLIVSDTKPDVNEIKTRMSKLLTKLRAESMTIPDYFACIGVSADGWENAAKSYETAAKMLSYAIVMQLNSIIDYNDMKTQRRSLYSKHKINLKELESLFSSVYDENIEDRCVNAIESIFAEIKSHITFTTEELYELITEMIFRIFGTLQIKGAGNVIKSGEGSDVIHMILNTRTIDEIKEWLILTVKEYIATKYKRNTESCRIAQELIKYVQMYYYREMSLKTLSFDYNLNPSYLGQMFKDETGVLFTEYLCNVRIEQAKKLLAETNMKTGDISAKIGFRNANYFSNVFKKKTGCYPTVYRDTERRKHIPTTNQFVERFNGELVTEEVNVFELQ